MAMPDLDVDGFLPEGIHEVTIAEVKNQFGRFQNTERRVRLFDKLEEFLAEAHKTDLFAFAIVNGSFVTSEDAPSDIDLVLVLKSDHDFTGELRPFEYNILSKRRVRKKFKFDVLVAREASAEYDEYVAFFQQVKEQPGRRKGVLKVVP